VAKAASQFKLPGIMHFDDKTKPPSSAKLENNIAAKNYLY
jgi:hypothetical protein